MTTDSNIRKFPGAEVPEQTLSVEREPFDYCAPPSSARAAAWMRLHSS